MREKSVQPLAIFNFIQPFQTFFRMEAASGIVLLFCTVVAVAWANSPFSESYFSLWHTETTIGAEGVGLRHSLHHWINDALMAVFFLIVGLEIKREVLTGGVLSRVKPIPLPINAMPFTLWKPRVNGLPRHFIPSCKHFIRGWRLGSCRSLSPVWHSLRRHIKTMRNSEFSRPLRWQQ